MSRRREPERPDFAACDRDELLRRCEALWEIVADVDYFEAEDGVIDGHFALDKEQSESLHAMLAEAYGKTVTVPYYG